MAAYLIDTHALLWFLDDSPKLSKSSRTTMEDEQAELMVSVMSLWEVAIKANLGKLEIEGDISFASRLELTWHSPTAYPRG